MKHKISFIFYLLTFILFSSCTKSLPDDVAQLISEVEAEVQPTPAIEVKNITFSPDDKYFTIATRTLHDIGPFNLIDTSRVRILVKESANGVPQHSMLPHLIAVRNAEAENIAASDIKMQVIVDLTLPQSSIDAQRTAIGEILTGFSHNNLFLSFMSGDSVTQTVPATPYVLNNYFREQPGNKRLYRSILQKQHEMLERKAPWDYASQMLLVVFSDQEVYLSNNIPIDPDHFALQQQLLQQSADSTGNLACYYVSFATQSGGAPLAAGAPATDIAAGSDDASPSVPVLQAFCQHTHGLYLPSFKWVDIKNSITLRSDLDNADYEFRFENPDFKVYRGSRYTLTLDFIDRQTDSLIASTSIPFRKGSIYKPVIVHGHSIGYVLLLGGIIGLFIIFLCYIILQYIVPFVRYRRFVSHNVITYTGPLMSAQNKVVAQSCYLCKAPFQEGDSIVVKCQHTMHKSCWDENDYHCPEYPKQCPEGSHYYDSQHPHSPRNAPFHLPWLITAIAATTIAWMVFLLLMHFTSSNHLERLISFLQLTSEATSSAPVSTSVNDFSEHEKGLPVFGLTIASILTIALSTLTLYRRNIRHKVCSIFLRAFTAGFISMLFYFIIGVIEAVFQMDSYFFLLEWIPWTLTALAIFYASTTFISSPQHSSSFAFRHSPTLTIIFVVVVAFLSMFVWTFFIIGSRFDFRILLLFSYLIFALGLVICIASPIPSSNLYFLRVEGPVKTIEVALYKWFRANPRYTVTIGKSVNASLQMTWDITSEIPPIQAKITMKQNGIYLEAEEDGIQLPSGRLQAGKRIHLYQNSQFQIGKTTFTYIEKDK